MKNAIETKIQGLSNSEVAKQKSLGLSNTRIDSYTPSYPKILQRSFISIMNIVIVPLIGLLFLFGVEREVLVFATFVFLNSLVNAFEEIRVKRRLEKLKSKFETKAKVIRDGEVHEILSSEVVLGDYVVAEEGESIIADGKIIESKVLQVDDSALTGESNYIEKETGDEVFSGSFVVTGNCIYEVKKVGANNYLNQLGGKASSFVEQKSALERNGEKFVYILIVITIILFIIYFASLRGGIYSTTQILLGLTVIAILTIPQTLLFMFGLSFIISITKLAQNGILIQKRGAIDDLAAVDVICLDKTGTITTNDMSVVESNFFSGSNDFDLELFVRNGYLAVENDMFGKNKTFDAIVENFKNKSYTHIVKNYDEELFKLVDQIPFTSRNKFSAVAIEYKNKVRTIVLGAPNITKKYVDKKQMGSRIIKEEKQGRRIILGAVFEGNVCKEIKNEALNKTTENSFFISLEEQMNPGVNEVIEELQQQDIQIMIISGDSLDSVERIIQKLNLNVKKTVNLSETKSSIEELIENGVNIFTRAKPEEKTKIIKLLQEKKHKVAMVGDGINDAISLKQSNIGIAMEHGTSVARDVSDIVLLENDYRKIPSIFYEGNNLVFNLKMTTKIFFARAVWAIIFVVYFSIAKIPIPILPTSTIIFSFAGNSLPSYFLSFSRQKLKRQYGFTKEILMSSIPTGIFMGILIIGVYLINREDMSGAELNTSLVVFILSISLAYTMYLFWEGGKLGRNWFLGIFAIVFGIVFGSMQAVVPVTDFDNRTVIYALTLLSFIMGIFVAYYVWTVSKNSNLKVIRVFVPFLPILAILLALFYPSRFLYGTSSFPVVSYFPMMTLAICGGIAVIGIHRIIKSFKTTK